MVSAVGTGRAMENGNGDPSTLAACGCCCVSDSGCSHSLPPSLPQKVAQAERQEVVLLQQCWVSMLLAGEDLLRASFKHRVGLQGQLALEHT